MDGCVGCMHVYVNGCMDAQMDGLMDAFMHVWTNAY